MAKQMKRHAKVWLSVILSILMVIGVFQISSIKTNAEGNEPNITPQNVNVGDIIKFGKYEQDGNTANGKEDIEWKVLKVEGDRALVISKYSLDCIPYNNSGSSVTWETCSLRRWLNNDFKNSAFTTDEQKRIPTVTITNENNPYYNTPGGNNTNDQLFVLSLKEAESLFGKYNQYDEEIMFGYNQNLICEPTMFARDISRGVWVFNSEISEDYYTRELERMGYTRDVIGLRSGYWWFRTPGESLDKACESGYFGLAGAIEDSSVDFEHAGVRPAMYLITSVMPSSISLDKTNAKMYFGEEMTLKATIKPDNATEKEIKWSVSDPSVASVNNGKVKIKNKAGKIKITAETVNGLKAYCDITVLCENNPNNPFADVKTGNWKYNAALFVYENGYMTGKGTFEGKVLFEPDSNITRGEFVQILYSAEGKPEVEYSPRFSDVPKGKWFTNAVLWAEKNGIVAGTPDGIFDVYGNATREQMAMMFYKYAAFKGYDTSVKEGGKTLKDFTDSGKVSGWAKPAVEWAVSRGIISGKGSAATGYQIDPQGNATRVETAAILRTFINSYAEPKSNLITEEYIYIDDVDNDIEENEDFSEENKFNVIN